METRMMFRARNWVLFVAVAVLGAVLALRATERRALADTCTADNLLAGKRPWQWQDVRGDTSLVTDGAIGPEGAQWDAPVAVTFDTGAGSVTYDLGQPTPIAALYVQADANDTYRVMGSLDGSVGSYKVVVEIENAIDRGHGLRARWVEIPPMTVRYLRVGEGVGDGFYSVSEFAVYCLRPNPFPPVMRTVSAPLAAVTVRPWTKLDWWEDKVSARFEMALAAAAFLLLLWGWTVERTGKDIDVPPVASKAAAVGSIGIYFTVAFLISNGTTWLPTWVTSLVCALSSAFTLLVSPFPSSEAFRASLRQRWPGRAETLAPGDTQARARRPPPSARSFALRNQLLVLVGVLSFQAYFNFGAFHFGNYVHYWDSYHYYIGSKYFKELSYDRLYECASVADSEDPTVRRRVELRKIMNLRTNFLGGTTEILAHPERCKDHFTPERWQKFKKDIEYFRLRHGVKRWEEAQTDHGYNGTPVWNILGTTLANLAPASDAQLRLLTAIDPVFIFGMVIMIWWAFGWQALCVALAVFGTNFPSRFYWTGGAYLRWDWLFHMTAGVCLVKKQRPILGGFLMMYSGLLRVFPVFLLLGPAFVIVHQVLEQTRGRPARARLPLRELPALLRKVDRSNLAVLFGALLAVVTLVPVSLVTSSGIDGYRMFVKNSKKHTATPLTNYMGWRTVVVYKEEEAGRFLKSDRLEDPWKDWKDARLRAFGQRKWLYVAGVLAFAGFLFRAVRGFSAWESAALSSLMIAVIPELTCYYYSFLIVTALLWVKRREVGIALLAATALTGFIDLAPTQYLPASFPWGRLRVMPTWLDEQYMWMSVVTLIALGWILYEFGFVARAELAGAAAGGAASTAVPPASAVVAGGAGTAAAPAPAVTPDKKGNRGSSSVAPRGRGRGVSGRGRTRR
jgi:hypothetical protein